MEYEPWIKDVPRLYQTVADCSPQCVVSVKDSPAGLQSSIKETISSTPVPESTELAVETACHLLAPVDDKLLLQLLLCFSLEMASC